MDYEITPPAKGQVTLTLDFDEAEILTRIIGRTNSGNLKAHSKSLYDFVQDMVGIVGRDNSEAKNYRSSVVGSLAGPQIYIDRVEDHDDTK